MSEYDDSVFGKPSPWYVMADWARAGAEAPLSVLALLLPEQYAEAQAAAAESAYNAVHTLRELKSLDTLTTEQETEAETALDELEASNPEIYRSVCRMIYHRATGAVPEELRALAAEGI